MLQNQEMTPAEVDKRLQALSALKLHPREQEVPRSLLARAERLYGIVSWGNPRRSGSGPVLVSAGAVLPGNPPGGQASRRMEQMLNSVEAYLERDPFADGFPQWEDPE